MIVVQQAEGESNKQAMAGLVRKLNCTASKKDLHHFWGDHEQYFVARTKDSAAVGTPTNRSAYPSKNTQNSSPPSMHMVKQQQQQQQRTASSWGVSNPLVRKSKPKSDITRPVLITVKDGDLSDDQVAASTKNRVGSYWRKSAPVTEIKSSFVVGELPSTKPMGLSPFKFGSPGRKNHQQPQQQQGLARTPSSSPKRITNHNHRQSEGQHNQYSSSESKVDTTKATSYPLTEKEIARRERWKKGFEMEQKTWKNNNSGHNENGTETDYSSRHKNNSNNDDANTQTSYTTGGTSSYTEDQSSIADDSTDATETDESGDDPSSYHYCGSGGGRNGGRATSKRSSSRAVQSSGHCSSKEEIFNEIKEDLGIVASLLWSDGVALIGGAAAITQETVAGCKDGTP